MSRTLAVSSLAVAVVVWSLVAGGAGALAGPGSGPGPGADVSGPTLTASVAPVDPCSDEPPTLSAGSDFATTKDETVRFVADLDGDAQAVSYEWRDGYGENGNGQGPGDEVLSTQPAFSTQLDPGNHQITLVVETESGETLRETLSVQVRGNGRGAQTDSPPVADAGDCKMVIAEEDATLNGSGSYDRDGTLTAYEWDTDGDGEIETTGERSTVQFSELGNRTVALTVTDDGANTDSDETRLFVNDRPDVAFDRTPDRPNPDEATTFDAGASTDDLGGIASYEWDFGDGTTATGQTVEHAFAEPGNYTVSLTVTDRFGVANTTEQRVHVNFPPEADASRSPDLVNVTESFEFDGSASSDVEDGIVSYEWDVDGDGEYEKTGEFPEHAYETGEDPTVTLRVTDDGGLTDTDNVSVEVNVPPDANASETPSLVNVTETFTLDASESVDDGPIAGYEWDVDGDGEFEKTGETVQHAYDSPEDRTVTLRVTGDVGLTDTTNVSIEVNAPPEADASETPDLINVTEEFDLDASASSDDGPIQGYEWDVDGDGEFEKAGEIAPHSYGDPADRNVTLRVTGDVGLTDTTTVAIEVNAPPEADASETPELVNVSEAFTLDGSLSTDDGEIASYEWDLDGDGTFEKTGATVPHAYETAGARNVTLRVTGDVGLTDTASVTVQVNAPPEADAGPDRLVNVSEAVTLNASGSTDDGAIVSYEWDLDGDGEFEQAGQSIEQSYDSPGERTVTVRVTDAVGLTDTATATVTVNAPPTAGIEGGDRTVLVGETLSFDGSASSDDGGIARYEWDFDGDGSTDATGQTVETAYDSDGEYTVTLTVVDEAGATDTASRTVTVVPESIEEDTQSSIPPGPQDPNSASATGDPHITTFDGVNYDFQGAGEFVLARSPGGSLSIQGRLIPRTGRPVSVIGAVATQLDGHNVTIDAADGSPLVVDGVRQDLSSTDRLAVGDGAVFRRGSTYVVVYPGEDGEVDAGDERLTVRERGSRVDVWLTLRSDRSQSVEGLLGTSPPDAPDVALANGTAVSPGDYGAMYGPFRADWRVDSRNESRFHYEAGESPDSFYDPDYPSALVTVDDLPDDERSAAEEAAIEAGLEPGTPEFRNAVLDYASTEDESYLDSAATSRPENASFGVEAGDSFAAGAGNATTFVAAPRDDAPEGVTYEWRFGDGTRATGREVSHAFDAPGTYTVTVTATGPEGGVTRDRVSVTVEENVTTDQPPVPELAVTRVNATHARVDASGSVDPDGTVSGYAWDLDGDGTVDRRGATATVALAASPQSVSVAVVDDDGNRVTGTAQVPGTNGAPTAEAGPDLNATVGATVEFDASASSDPDGDALTYEWDFGDGASATGVAPDHEFALGGTYVVTLTVTDEHGARDTDTLLVDVVRDGDGEGPRVVLYANRTVVEPGDAFRMDASESEGRSLDYEWAFGDGTTASGATVSHAFDAPGRYTVELTVTDGLGQSRTTTRDVVVRDLDRRFDGFEDGLGEWSIRDGNFGRSSRSIQGSYSAANAEDDSSEVQARWNVYDGGDRPRKFSYYYWETSDSNGGGIRLKNSDGNVEVGFATDNPRWYVHDGDGTRQIYGGDGYQRWVYVEITFDWENDEYVLYVEDQRSGTTRMHVGDLRHGTDIETAEIANWNGDGWRGGEDFHMWIDAVEFDGIDVDDPQPTPRAQSTRRSGDNYRLSDDDGSGDNSYAWEFGDGLQRDGAASPVHRYERSGTYTAQVAVRNQYGIVNRDTVTVRVNPTEDYRDGFEHGLRTWNVRDGDFGRSSRSIQGRYSAANAEDDSSEVQARDRVYPGGHQPRKFSYYYWETSDSNGGGIRLKNSDGNVEVGFATDNPRWYVHDGDGTRQIYGGDGYQRWVYVEITFDWENDEYVLYVEDQRSGTTRMYSGDLRHGTDIETAEIANWNGDGWRGGEDFHMWIDDVQFQSATPDGSWPDLEATATRGRGDIFELSNATDGNRGGRTYFWEFGDGLKQQGATPHHKYERAGTYTAKVSVRAESGKVTRDTVTLGIDPDDDYHESFERGLRVWDVRDGNFGRSSRSIHGSYSAANAEDSSSKIQARDTVYPGGHQPRKFSYYYWETSDSNGGGIRLKNSNGDIEVGFATDNPRWYVHDGDGTRQIYGGDGYQRWVYVEITFDWKNDEYTVYVEDQRSGTERLYSGPLRHGTDIETAEIANWNGDGWRGGEDFHMWIDDVRFESMTPDESWPEVDATATRGRGDIFQLSNDSRANDGDRTYYWEFGDGLDQQGDAPHHKYERAGSYTATVWARNDEGKVTRDTVTLEIDPDDDYHESFERGLRVWDVRDGDFGRSSRSIHGSYSAANAEDDSSEVQARDRVYPGGHQPRKFSYYYWETSDSNGGGIRLKNSDGNVEVGFATDNPRWYVHDGEGTRQIYGGDGYQRWVYVEITFDWKNDEYTVYVEDQRSGTERLYSGPLRHGKDIETAEIANWNGNGWRGGEDFHMWIDDVRFESIEPDESWPEVDATATRKRGDIFELANDSRANDGDRTYYWEFGDGLDQQGDVPRHKYERAGEYTATVWARDDEGKVTRDTVTLGIDPDDDYHESFERGLRVWDVRDGNFGRSSRSIHGSYSAANAEDDSSKIQARDTVYPGGHRPETFSYYYWETSDSNGGGLRVKNSDGNVEMGFATDNPRWYVHDGDGTHQIYGGDGYQRWVYVEVTFDWANGEFTVFVEDQRSGTTRTYTGDLRHGKDVETVEIANWNGDGWRGGEDFHMWVDDVRFEDDEE